MRFQYHFLICIFLLAIGSRYLSFLGSDWLGWHGWPVVILWMMHLPWKLPLFYFTFPWIYKFAIPNKDNYFCLLQCSEIGVIFCFKFYKAIQMMIFRSFLVYPIGVDSTLPGMLFVSWSNERHWMDWSSWENNPSYCKGCVLKNWWWTIISEWFLDQSSMQPIDLLWLGPWKAQD